MTLLWWSRWPATTRCARRDFRRHGRAVHALVKRVTHDSALAEEVTQELFVRLWNEPERYDPARGTLRTFLLLQAQRRSIDIIRSEEARKRRELSDAATIATSSYNIDHEFGDLADRETPITSRDGPRANPSQVCYTVGLLGSSATGPAPDRYYRIVCPLRSVPETTEPQARNAPRVGSRDDRNAI
ncbi:sigma-70 family RNA polymerase sigma factor [Ferrimicrobium acidiphilum]|uniref:Sigma-70 family RNA polymerase sigma factor n=1 Tax=Ferrimicrobium acidiphilum TaxID=121039 RepID=A0ABV3XYP6_9ACTN